MMMITINVLSFKGQPLPDRLSANFNEAGGSIGRRDDNRLVLPDPERRISRVHAFVEFRGGNFVIVDQGSAEPVMVNRTALGNGREAIIKVGDEIRIGAYVMSVGDNVANVGSNIAGTAPVKSNPPSSIDPFADLLGPASATPNSSSSPFDLIQDTLQKAEPAAAQFAIDDPFAMPSGNSPNQKSGSTNQPQKHAAQQNAAAHLIPDDFDPFAEFAPASSSDAQHIPTDFDLGLASGSTQNIDALFGLGKGGEDFSKPLMTSDDLLPPTDPLSAFGVPLSPTADSSRSQRNDASELQASIRLPEPRSAEIKRAAEPAEKDSSQSSSGLDPLALFGGASADSDIENMFSSQADANAKQDKTEIVAPRVKASVDGQKTSSAEARLSQTPASSQTDAPKTGSPQIASQQISSQQSSSPQPQRIPSQQFSSQQREELLQALLEGAGVADLEMATALTPQLMNMIGKLLRTSTQGTLDLLQARAVTKREVRADMTMIGSQENNPLKFSPNADVALSHLLAPQGRGFLTPLRAMQGAYNDLRAHQLGMMAGMQAALSGVLVRFSPERLEKRLQQKSVVDSLLPMNRRAKLWDLFTELYGDISKEAEDDFHALFGREFLRAYEEQIAKLNSEGRGE